MKPSRLATIAAALAAISFGAACTSGSRSTAPSSAQPAATTTPMPAAPGSPGVIEKVPAGDIPDTQAFVTLWSGAGGYKVDAPEGWARSGSGGNVRYESAYNGESVALAKPELDPLTLLGRDAVIAVALGNSTDPRDIRFLRVTLPVGPAVLLSYHALSAPNPVTGKRARLDYQTYIIRKPGKVALLTLWAPSGSDNVDQWKRIARSFRWWQ